MKFRNLVKLFGEFGIFDWAAVSQLSAGSRDSLRIQLHRWCESGRIIRLRRGVYALASEYRKSPLNVGLIANVLYRPSYLSLHWALGYYGLIPEQVITLTSVTSRKTSKFTNAQGVFDYRNLKQSRFWGYTRLTMGNDIVLLATPEKALLDFWYLERGSWTPERMREMRFQNFEAVDPKKLKAAVARFNSPKVTAAAKTWLELAGDEKEGVIVL